MYKLLHIRQSSFEQSSHRRQACRTVQQQKSSHRTGDQEVQSEHAYAGRQEASPEDGGAVEGSALLNGEQQPSDWRCKSSGYTCRATHVVLSYTVITNMQRVQHLALHHER